MNAPVEHYEYRYKLETASTYPSTGDRFLGRGGWTAAMPGHAPERRDDLHDQLACRRE